MQRVGHDYFAYMTGGKARVATAPNPRGPWTSAPDALTRFGAWASGAGAVWAPDSVHTSAGWVLYYAVQAKGFAGQRCIGTAIGDNPAGPYEPSDTPLICPILGGEDPAADRPDQTAGVIDPSPFQARDGRRYLLYKTQKTPGTIRMFPLSSDGLHGRGELSHELVRHADSIENPMMVQRGGWYVLFASANWYDQCTYSTVWRRSRDMWSFADKTENVLMDKASTGLCGPGGADVISGPGGPSRIFLHAWVCSEDNQPCQYDGVVTDPAKRRVIYAAVLVWGRDGATPSVPAFLRPRT
jgi:beta-xylosidase